MQCKRKNWKYREWIEKTRNWKLEEKVSDVHKTIHVSKYTYSQSHVDNLLSISTVSHTWTIYSWLTTTDERKCLVR